MHCYGCNLLLDDVSKALDNRTGRYYCGACFEPTEYEILRAKYLKWKQEHPDEESEITPEEFEALKDKEEESILEEYTHLMRQRERALYLNEEVVEDNPFLEEF